MDGFCATWQCAFEKTRPDRIYCSQKCKDQHQLSTHITHVCPTCQETFLGRAKRKYCSGTCAARARVPWLVERNKRRRKYPPIEGMSRYRVFYRFNAVSRQGQLTRDLLKRLFLVRVLGGRCVQCGYKSDLRALVLDHVRGDGKQDRLRVGSKIQRYYTQHIDEARQNLQLLCANCNLLKSLDNHEHNISRRIALVG